MKKAFYLLWVALAFATGYYSAKKKGSGNALVEIVTDTVFVRDTTVIVAPQAAGERKTGHKKLLFAKADVGADSVAHADSIALQLPTVSRQYAGEGYAAVVSGVEPRLDSIIIYEEWPQVTRTLVPPATKRSRWSVGLSGGVAATPRGFQPYIGVGVSYSLFIF